MALERDSYAVYFVEVDVVHCSRYAIGHDDRFADEFLLSTVQLLEDAHRSPNNHV